MQALKSLLEFVRPHSGLTDIWELPDKVSMRKQAARCKPVVKTEKAEKRGRADIWADVAVLNSQAKLSQQIALLDTG